MKKFVVAYISYFDNVLTQEVIEATSSMEAMRTKLLNVGWDMSDTNFETEEDIKEFAFDSDAMISAYEIP